MQLDFDFLTSLDKNKSVRCEASHLLSNQLVAFPEDVAALGVSQDHPVHPAVLYHGRTGATRQQCSEERIKLF